MCFHTMSSVFAISSGITYYAMYVFSCVHTKYNTIYCVYKRVRVLVVYTYDVQ